MCGRLSFLDPDGRCSAAWPPRAARPIPQPSAPGRNLTPTALPALLSPSDPPQLHPSTVLSTSLPLSDPPQSRPSPASFQHPSPPLSQTIQPQTKSQSLEDPPWHPNAPLSFPRPAPPPVTSYTHNNGDNPTRLPRRPSYLQEKYLTYGKWTGGRRTL